jgi:Ca2+-binding RTX toxin-like protein
MTHRQLGHAPNIVLFTALMGMVLSASPEARADRRNDLLVTLDSANAFVFLEVDGFGADAGMTRGTLSIETDDPNCVASPSNPCSYVINYLRVEFSGFVQPTTEGDFTFADPFVVLQGPIAVTDSGFGIVVPTGQPSQVGGNASGPGITTGFRRNTQGIPQPLTINMDVVNEAFTLEGEFLADLGGFTAEASIVSTADSPFLNVPPVADAGPDASFGCGGPVLLDGTASSDENDTIDLYRWSVDGVGLRTLSAPAGSSISASLGLGTHEVTLEVFDTFGGKDSDTATITVTESAPSFTFVPPAIAKVGCGPVALGQATASAACGSVVITNDAPASFPVGRTVVTWTATVTPASGPPLQTTATQVVTVLLGDNSACCPAGYNVIKGNSNNNTLNGTSGNDCILGFGAQDTINGNGGNDIISAGDGDDVITGGAGDDNVNGGSGQDRITDSVGNDTLSGGDGDDRVEGGPGNDALFGGQGQDRLICGDGNDSAFGEDGSDTLEGGLGNDVLDGGPGGDTCSGGGGSDSFVSCP